MSRPSLLLPLVLCGMGLALAALPARPAEGFQHVANGGFESGASDWATDGATQLSVGATSAHDGAAGAHLSGTTKLRLSSALPQALDAGTYSFEAWVRPATDADATLRISSSGYGQLESTTLIEGGAWTKVTAALHVPEAAQASISIIIAASEADVDDVSLDGAPPVTLTPTPTNTPVVVATPTVLAGTPSATATPLGTQTPVVDVISASVRNPGFEEIDAAGAPFAWDGYGGTLFATTHAHGGSRAARLTSATDSTKWVHQAVTATGGGWYSFGAHVAVVDAGVESTFLRISWYASADASGSAISTVDSTARLTAPTGYQPLTTGAVQAPLEARSARLRIMLAPLAASAATIDMDDVTFGAAAPTLVAEPTLAPASLPADGRRGEPPASARASSRSQARSGSATNRRSGVSQSGEPGPAVATVAGNAVTINEVLYDAAGDTPDADAEWVELYNASSDAIDLRGWALGDGSGGDTLPAVVVQPGAFAIVAASSAFFDAYPDFTGDAVSLGTRIGNGLGNDGDALFLYDPSGSAVDAVAWGDNAFVLDPSIDDVPAGHSIERRVPGSDADTAGDWIDNERPSPGASYESPVDVGSLEGGSVPVFREAGAGAWNWLPWALAAASVGALACVASWRALEVLRSRLRQQP